MKFILLIFVIAVVCHGNEDIMEKEIRESIKFIKDYPGTVEDMKKDIIGLMKGDKESYEKAEVDEFCKRVCDEITGTKITCDDFTKLIVTELCKNGNMKATDC